MAAAVVPFGGQARVICEYGLRAVLGSLAFMASLRYWMDVTVRGTVRNGVVVLPPEAQLPDGSEVEISPVDAAAGDPSFLCELLKLARDRDWPSDFALNHAHYAKGHPRKA